MVPVDLRLDRRGDLARLPRGRARLLALGVVAELLGDHVVGLGLLEGLGDERKTKHFVLYDLLTGTGSGSIASSR